MENSDEAIECAVCLQPSIHPVQLPCSHIFCFLCVKGVTIQSQRCPMCRREIPQSYLEHPTLLKQPESLGSDHAKESSEQTKHKEDSEDETTLEPEYRWFYQGRNGWWEYDERTTEELEHHHKKGDKSCELLIAGFLYSIDFENMLQCRRNEPQRRRQIKRDLITNVADKKGIAGIRTTASTQNNSNNAVVDNLASRMSNVQIAATTSSATTSDTATNSSGSSRTTTTTRAATLQDLVDLGAASSGANIAIRDTTTSDDDEDDSNVV